MPDPHKNFAYGTVLTAPSPATSGTSLVLNSAQGALFPAPATDGAFNVVIAPANTQPTAANAEIVRVTARATDTLTITRTQEGTSARTVIVGDQVFLAPTAKVFTDTDQAYTPIKSNVVWPLEFSPYTNTGSDVIGTSIARGVRLIMPYTGTLTGMAVAIGGVQAGNIDLELYDTTVTTRNKLTANGSTACGAVNTWQVFTISLAVTAGAHIDCAFMTDNATVRVLCGQAVNNMLGLLPTGYLTSPLGGKPAISWASSQTYPLPATISEASISTNNAPIAVLVKY